MFTDLSSILIAIFKTIKKFIELNERKLIVNNDLTSYKTFDELELQMSLAQLKLILILLRLKF